VEKARRIHARIESTRGLKIQKKHSFHQNNYHTGEGTRMQKRWDKVGAMRESEGGDGRRRDR